jgi:hypothetical protein
MFCLRLNLGQGQPLCRFMLSLQNIRLNLQESLLSGDSFSFGCVRCCGMGRDDLGTR